jgi:radical SAM protein with 4Fe4S-binding SPASM domain
MKHDTKCKLAELSLMLDMSGMVSPCPICTWWYKDTTAEHHHMFDVNDDLRRVWKSPHRQEFVQHLENGERIKECDSCWQKEEIGVVSMRQQVNQDFADVESHPDQPRVIIIKPGIQCNNACRSCNEITSTAWFKDAYEFDKDDGYDKPFKIWLKKWEPHTTIYKNNQLLEDTFDEWQKELVFWDLYGGEPLMIPLSYKILESAVSTGGAKNQILGTHTNGTIYDPKLVDYFKEFKLVNFAISIDGVGAKNDYLRYGSKWDEVLAVTDKYLVDVAPYSNIKTHIRCSPTILNVFDMDELYAEGLKRRWPISFENYVLDEPHNNIQYMPYELKLKLAEKFKTINRLREVVKFLMGTPPDYTHEKQISFWHHNAKLDQLRSERFANVFPEWHALWADWIARNG